MHDLTRLILHFYLFLGVTAFQERIDMWQQVEGDRMWKNCRRRRAVGRSLGQGGGLRFIEDGFFRVAHRATATGFLILRPSSCLPGQLFNTTNATARDCLISCSENPTCAENLMQRVERHEHHGCGAIRIRDDSSMES